MEFSIKVSGFERLKTSCLLVPVASNKQLSASAVALDAALDGAIARALKSGDLPAKAGSSLLVHTGRAIARVILVSFGDAGELSDRSFGDSIRAAFRQLAQLSSADAVSLLHEAPVGNRAVSWKIRSQILIMREVSYKFDAFKTKKEPAASGGQQISFLLAAQDERLRTEVDRAIALANGCDLSKDLSNMPPNLCTPGYLAERARKLGRSHKMRVEVLDQKQIEALKMGAFLAVAKGSEQPPKFIVMHYQGAAAKRAPVVLVGKGITFDTGGISLKPAPDMDEMKFDMCGAASVLGTMAAIAEMKLRINVVAVVPTCENMPSGRACRPGDIVTTMSGQTVEILNTDAEGRLILCDALTYVERFKPALVIDIATLTGACVVALGNHHSGLFCKVDTLATELIDAGRDINDTCWRMPLDDEYQDGLKSPFADMANIGGRAGGAITAACYLARFTKSYDWAHLDIAGTAWKSGANKGASGRPVGLLTKFLIARAE